MRFDALLYDGITGHPHKVNAEFDATGVALSQDSGWHERVEQAKLCPVAGDRSSVRVGRTDIDGWRLVLPAAAQETVTGLLGKDSGYGRWVDRLGLVPALIVFAVVACAVLAIGHFAPHWVAPYVPERWERNVGDAIVGDFGNNRCRNPAGQQALDALAERLEPGSTHGPDRLRLAALDVNVFNAAALPGDHIVVFKGALNEIDDPDALAGILAHEIAHVRRRHVTEALLRELGIGALIRLFAGNVGANAEQLVSLSYTRANEAQADSDAIATLRRAGISPKATADLFRKLAKQTDGLGSKAEFLQSHPLSATRAAKFDASFDPHAHYRPALSQAQASALLNACVSPKNSRRDAHTRA
jgi:hypothetical protein